MSIETWCANQKSSCPLLCLQLPGTTAATRVNSCQPVYQPWPWNDKHQANISQESLTFSCVCSNGQQPNASEYSQTIPYFICTEYDNQCVNNCGGNPACQAACRTDHPCGAQDPKRVNSSTSTTMSATATSDAAASSGGSMVYTGFGGAAATSTAGSSGGTSGASSLALSFGNVYGLTVVATGFFAGFAFML